MASSCEHSNEISGSIEGKEYGDVRLGVLTAMRSQVAFSWVLMPYSIVEYLD
jgi:hypothetical protein